MYKEEKLSFAEARLKGRHPGRLAEGAGCDQRRAVC
jgi:hypothetical protein